MEGGKEICRRRRWHRWRLSGKERQRPLCFAVLFFAFLVEAFMKICKLLKMRLMLAFCLAVLVAGGHALGEQSAADLTPIFANGTEESGW